MPGWPMRLANGQPRLARVAVARSLRLLHIRPRGSRAQRRGRRGEASAAPSPPRTGPAPPTKRWSAGQGCGPGGEANEAGVGAADRDRRQRHDHKQAEAFGERARQHERERKPQASAREPSVISEKSGDAARRWPAQFRRGRGRRAWPWRGGLAKLRRSLALPRFEAAVRLVDDVGAAAAADDAAVPVARLKRLQAIANLHGRAPASFSSCGLFGMVQEPAAQLESGAGQVKAGPPRAALRPHVRRCASRGARHPALHHRRDRRRADAQRRVRNRRRPRRKPGLARR